MYIIYIHIIIDVHDYHAIRMQGRKDNPRLKKKKKAKEQM